jgi:hypothetical protein
VFPQGAENTDPSRTEGDAPTVLKMSQFGRRYIIMKTRARVTKDGGTSVLVVPAQESEESESEEEASEPEESEDEESE